MHFAYCPQCGTKLIEREIGDEGKLPFCARCGRPFFDLFQTSVICAVVNESDEIALLRQNYVSESHFVCVAGIMRPGETAEETASREIKEELGLDAETLEYVHSYYYSRQSMLMIGFRAAVKKADFKLSVEVDRAEWVPLLDAPEKLREGGIAWQLVNAVIEQTLR